MRARPRRLPGPPRPAGVYVRPGELWALGAHRLVVGDATDAVAVSR